MTAPRRNTGSLTRPVTDSELPPKVLATHPEDGAGRYSLVAPRGDRGRSRQRRPLTALIIEADEGVGRFVIDVFSLSGHAPLLARSLSDARLRLEEAPFDLVLLDLQVDGESSAELLNDLTTHEARPAIVLASSHRRAAAIADELGLTFLPKPFEVADLMSTVDRAVFERPSLPPPGR